MLQAFIILLSCQLIGELLVRLTHLPVPGPVAGMAILLAAFILRGKVPESLRAVSRQLLTNLSLLFVPAGTGILVHLHRLQDNWPLLTATLLLSTALTLVVTAAVFRLVQRWVAGDPHAAPAGKAGE